MKRLARSAQAIITVALMICVLGCEYEPDETYFKNIEAPDLDGFILDLLGTNNDTVYMFATTKFTVQVDVGAREIQRLAVLVDDVPINIYQTSALDFTVDATLLKDGQHKLRVELYAKSGTRSLADIAGVEQLQLSREWVAFVDNTPPATAKLTTAKVVNSRMMVNWKRYSKFNFSAYVLEKQYWSEGHNQYLYCWTKEFTDKNVTSFHDSTFLEGKIRYRLSVKAGSTTGDATVKTFEYLYNPLLAYEWIDNESVRITWRKPSIRGSFKNYSFSFNNQPSQIITNISDTSVVLKPEILFGFGKSFGLTINTQGKPCKAEKVSYTWVTLGKPFLKINGWQLSWHPGINKYFGRTYSDSKTFLSRFNGSTLELEQSIPSPTLYAMSPSGQYLYITYNNVLRQLDPLTFNVVKTYNLYELADTYTVIGGSLQITDDHTISFTTYNGNYVLKMPDYQILYKGATDFTMAISPSGNTLVSNGTLWRRNGSSYVASGAVPGTFRPIFKDDNTLIKFFYRERLAVQNLQTMEEKSVEVPEVVDNITYDHTSGLIGLAEETYNSNTTNFHLFNVTPARVKTFPIWQVDNHRGEHIFLLNNQIICSTGFIIPLSYYYP